MLVLIGFCGCGRLTLAARFVLGVTVTSIIVVVAAAGAAGFYGTYVGALLLMVEVGAINSYIWFMQIGFLPIYEPTEEDINPPPQAAGRLEDGDIHFGKSLDGISVETQVDAADLEEAMRAGGGGRLAAAAGPLRSVPLGAGSGAGKPVPMGYEAEAAMADEFRPSVGASMGESTGSAGGQSWR